MTHPYWPLFDLRVRTPRLEIRLPTDEDCVELARVVEAGVHDPAKMPFLTAWTDTASPERERSSLQWWWRARANWQPTDWNFTGAVVVDGHPVGVQDLAAKDFAVARSVNTGSWLGRSVQGRGLGREMRAAILHLAFAGLGAVEALSGAFEDNPRSLGVSAALGYRHNGSQVLPRRGQPAAIVNLRLDRSTWEAGRRDDITIEGLEPCLPLFGALIA